MVIFIIRGDRLKKIRQAKGWTQKQLANVLGLTNQEISYYENEIRSPRSEAIIDIVNIFGVTADYLLGIENSVRTINEEETPFEFIGVSKEEITFLEELKKDKFIYSILLEDPKRLANNIINKIG